MPVSTTMIIGTVVSLFYALFIVTVYIYCQSVHGLYFQL